MSAELTILVVLFWVVPLGLFPLIAHDRGQDWRWVLLWSFFGGWVGGGFALLLLSKGSRPASPLIKMKTLSLAIGVLFLIFHPWPHYQWSSSRDSVSSYEGFVSRFPNSGYSDSARERIRILSEDDVWDAANGPIYTQSIDQFRNYRNVYPDGQYLASAKEQIRRIADDRYRLSRISSARSLATINNFLRDYPETSKREDVEKRIQELYNDWEWVREQDSLEHYQRFAARFQSHPQSTWLAKRIIDLEVKEIEAGKYGKMPRAQPLKFGGTTTKVEVENQTRYELTVRYSGPDSQKLVIPKGMTKTISLPPGDYKVAASVTASNVSNYYGTDTMRGGQYSSSFTIQTDYGGFSLPNYIPKPKR